MNFAHRFTDLFTIQSQTSATASGDPVYESPKRSVKGLQRTVNDKVITSAGERIVQRDIFETDKVILPTDRYWPPGADVNNDRAAKRFGRVTKGQTLGAKYTMYRADLK